MSDRRRSWPASVICRVYCPACGQWYQATVLRSWYVRHFVTHPDVPAVECGHCARAKAKAAELGGVWFYYRNWEQAAADVLTVLRPPHSGESPSGEPPNTEKD